MEFNLTTNRNLVGKIIYITRIRNGATILRKRCIQIENIPAISAIYFALLQTGYDFFRFEKPNELTDKLSRFINDQYESRFFSYAKQTTCDVYPYWPRASMLEAASFYVDLMSFQFRDFAKFKTSVMAANNIKEAERNSDFWNWITDFPMQLKQILTNKNFQAYFEWENDWIAKQNCIYTEELSTAQKCLNICNRLYDSPITDVLIVVNPIKCAYSADYHIRGKKLIFSSGTFSAESVIHEFIHHVAHSIITSNSDGILQCDISNLGIDRSYYLTNDDAGILNAFEEYFVRRLTVEIIADNPPKNLSDFLSQTLVMLK